MLTPCYQATGGEAVGTLLTKNHRPIMTISTGRPDNAYVKGGLFRKSGVDLPKPVAQIFMQRKEKWEEPLEGVKSLDLD